jgi:hypothetical protein
MVKNLIGLVAGIAIISSATLFAQDGNKPAKPIAVLLSGPTIPSEMSPALAPQPRKTEILQEIAKLTPADRIQSAA